MTCQLKKIIKSMILDKIEIKHMINLDQSVEYPWQIPNFLD